MKRAVLAALTSVLATSTVQVRSKGGWRKSLKWAAKGSWLLLNPRSGVQVARALTSVQARPLLRAEPRLMFRYLFSYLATDLSRTERAAMMIHHYALLKERADENFFARIIDRRIELWQWVEGESVYRIDLSFPLAADGEGDLALFFRANGSDIYALSFTIGPGSIAGLSSRDAMYIARVQGKNKGIDLIRQATKDCHDVSPAMLLLAAAEGIALALDLRDMVGIGADVQISTSIGKNPDDLVKAYDEFWKALGGVRLDRSMYHIAVPMTGKSILLIKRDHRSRTQRKRRFKKLVRAQVGQAFRDVALCAATSEKRIAADPEDQPVADQLPG